MAVAVTGGTAVGLAVVGLCWTSVRLTAVQVGTLLLVVGVSAVNAG